MGYKTDFVNKLKPHAIKGWKNYHILPSLTIAQAILETGWGKSSIGNNIFGIKADNSWRGKRQLVETQENYNGTKINITAWFRDYDSVYDSIEDRYKFLQAERYRKVVGEKNYKKACKEILKAGYATDPQYATKLIQIIEQNNLQEIDQIAFAETSSPKIDNTISSWAKTAWEYCRKLKLIDGTRPKDRLQEKN